MKYGEYFRMNFGSCFGYVIGARDYFIVGKNEWSRFLGWGTIVVVFARGVVGDCKVESKVVLL